MYVDSSLLACLADLMCRQEWLFGEGLTLPVPIEYDTTLAKASYALAAQWDTSRSKDVSELDFKPDDVAGMDTNQISTFLFPTCFVSNSDLIPFLRHHSAREQSCSWSVYSPRQSRPFHTHTLST